MAFAVGADLYRAHMGYPGAYKPAFDSGAGSASGASDTSRAKAVVNPEESKIKAPGRTSSPAECQTCKERKYQDGSDEGDVSFKTAQHIDPNAAGAAVRAHENMHVQNAFEKAAKGNGKVLEASVSIHTAVCPECGRVYVSGGTTHTRIKYKNESNPYTQNAKSSDAANGVVGMNFDSAA